MYEHFWISVVPYFYCSTDWASHMTMASDSKGEDACGVTGRHNPTGGCYWQATEDEATEAKENSRRQCRHFQGVHGMAASIRMKEDREAEVTDS